MSPVTGENMIDVASDNFLQQNLYNKSLVFLSIAWCDNLVPNVYGTEVYLTCSLNDAQDVIIFQV